MRSDHVPSLTVHYRGDLLQEQCGMNTLFVVDLDGTILDNRERLRRAGPEPSRDDLPTYLRWLEDLMDPVLMKDDPLVPGMLDFVRSLHMSSSAMDHVSDTEVIYLTARNENLRSITKDYLRSAGFPILALYMRASTDVRKDSDVKRDILRTFGNRPIVVIDDDPTGNLANVCREEGWTLLKAVSCLTR